LDNKKNKKKPKLIVQRTPAEGRGLATQSLTPVSTNRGYAQIIQFAVISCQLAVFLLKNTNLLAFSMPPK
jgi:hypothetical protein